IHSVRFQHCCADQRRVTMDVVHRGKESEIVLVLHYPKNETAPLERIRYGDHVSAYVVDRHVAVIDRHEFDVSRIVDGTPDERSITRFLEPTAERVVPT